MRPYHHVYTAYEKAIPKYSLEGIMNRRAKDVRTAQASSDHRSK
jgi:hypothetical protein